MRFFLFLQLCSSVLAFTPGSSDIPFSLSAYQKARAKATSNALDASRFHFQILFVDNDNFHARIAEGMLSRIAEYNDALFTLFPYSATIAASPNAPIDSTAPKEAVVICDNLGLCSTTCSEDGTSFNLFESLDQYDLIIACNDEIQNQILRSLPSPTSTSTTGYEQKCRSLGEFLSLSFCGAENDKEITQQTIQDMIEPGMWEMAKPYYDASCSTNGGDIFSGSMSSDVYSNPRIILNENGAAIPNQSGWPLVEAAMLVACAGITRFLLDTLDAQFDTAFAQLLDRHFYRHEHLNISIEAADDQLRRGSLSITGYFSPKERKRRIVRHFEALRSKLKNSDS